MADTHMDIKDGMARVEKALSDGVPQIYFNGFINMLGTADIGVLCERNGKPVAVLNMSYTVAKTLAVALGQTIGDLEQKTGKEMLTTMEVEQKLRAPSS
jgi:hypothetical protein